jgi:hypothetical protein
VLCEGVEVTDAAVFEVNGPARGELRWDAEYDESEFEVEIPPDYEQML